MKKYRITNIKQRCYSGSFEIQETDDILRYANYTLINENNKEDKKTFKKEECRISEFTGFTNEKGFGIYQDDVLVDKFGNQFIVKYDELQSKENPYNRIKLTKEIAKELFIFDNNPYPFDNSNS